MGIPRFLTGILAAPLLLSACGGGSDSVADPPVSPSSTSSSTATPQRESARDFVRHWVEEDTRMQNSGDTTAFRAMSMGCRGCDAVADRVDSIYDAGGSVHTEGWSLLRVHESTRSGGTRTFELIVNSAPTTYTPAKGATPKHLAGGREHFQIQVMPANGSWTVGQFVQVSI